MKKETKMESAGMTYKSVGVNYDDLDPYKRLAQTAASMTDMNIERLEMSVTTWSRGESTFLIEQEDQYIAFTIEGLGTKNLVADALFICARDHGVINDQTFYANIGVCNCAMAFNDMITLGAKPIVYGQYVAAGLSTWFDGDRSAALASGTKIACDTARCVWGPGETPALKGIILPEAVDLAGACVGIVRPKELVINPTDINHGDIIIFLHSSGIHANGLTIARKIADNLPNSYLTRLPDGRTYGQTLLDPTNIYVGVVEDCIEVFAYIHYAVNITGHGWRKIMRAPQNFSYIIEKMPPCPPIFDFMMKHGPISTEEAFSTFNMGAGFALILHEANVDLFERIMKDHGHEYGFGYTIAGHVEYSIEKKVVIKPIGLEFKAESLNVR